MSSPPQTQPSAESPRSSLLQMIRGFRVSQMIAVAAKLRIADHLAEGSKNVAELARITESHEDSLYRVMRALASLGIFAEEDGLRFGLTPMAEFLRSDVAGSVRGNAEAVGEEWMWRPWGALLHSVKTGEAACDSVFQKGTWEWFAEHPAAGELFDRCMDETTAGDAEKIAAAYEFGRLQTIVDVAGGRGVLLSAILRRFPLTRGILFNLPQVIEGARKVLDADAMHRIELVPGDFFQTVPGGGDVYILKNIIHDWNDRDSILIFKTCRQAMPVHARLLIIEHVVGGPNQTAAAKLGDVLMMVRTGGRNRTADEHRALLSATGFELSRILPVAGGPDLIEAVPTN